VPEFADFESARGKRVLEIGVGAGTDFLNWVRAGARVWGVDLSAEAVEHARRRLAVYGLEAEEVQQADCESLPYPDEHFDVVYSWGVIHHTPDSQQALREIVRVCRVGGTCKLMVYNRHSVVALTLWVKWALLRAQPWRSLTDVLSEHMESQGTRAFTRSEMTRMLRELPVSEPVIRTHLTRDDRLLLARSRVARLAGRLLSRFLGQRAGWFMTLQFTREAAAATT